MDPPQQHTQPSSLPSTQVEAAPVLERGDESWEARDPQHEETNARELWTISQGFGKARNRAWLPCKSLPWGKKQGDAKLHEAGWKKAEEARREIVMTNESCIS